jgi:hypothetical protein
MIQIQDYLRDPSFSRSQKDARGGLRGCVFWLGLSSDFQKGLSCDPSRYAATAPFGFRNDLQSAVELRIEG